MTKTRTERDTMGPVQVPADRYWGAQTQRSLEQLRHRARHLRLGAADDARARLLKKALRRPTPSWELGADVAEARRARRRRGDRGDLDDHFPLVVFQTGVGTQSNMNANEVISNRAIELAGGDRGSKTPVHPNDDVNRGQSSNDTFPTAMHIAVVLELNERLYPAVAELRDGPRRQGRRARRRRHGGAHPPPGRHTGAPGQEIGAWAAQVRRRQGGGEVCRGAGSRPGHRRDRGGHRAECPGRVRSAVARHLTEETGLEFHQAENLFAAARVARRARRRVSRRCAPSRGR
jgi:fumarate hydratase class II